MAINIVFIYCRTASRQACYKYSPNLGYLIFKTGIYYLISGYRVKKLNGKYQNKNYKLGQSVPKTLHGLPHDTKHLEALPSLLTVGKTATIKQSMGNAFPQAFKGL